MKAHDYYHGCMRIVKKYKKFLKSKIIFLKVKFSDIFYWLKCHLLPSYKFHMLDLRQPHPRGHHDYYRYGWIDADHQLFLASFKILENFIKHELENFYRPTNLEVQQMPALLSQQKAYDEITAIYEWWKYHRYIEIDSWKNKTYHEKNDLIYHRENEMLIRLINIRNCMWT